MPIVTVDGETYVPLSAAEPIAAIGITTRNRPEILAETLRYIDKFTPPGWPVFIVDDASETPVVTGANPYELYRFPENVGIPAAKNKCLELCMKTGADHIFLLDDDCYPALENWWKPYVFGRELHYNYIFTSWSNDQPVGDCDELYNDGSLRAFSHVRGCAMYLHRKVVERVGGFNPAFGHGMNEHVEYSQRVCNAGLTTFNYQDVPDSDDLWYSLDRAQSVTRTIPATERAELLRRNNEILEALQGDDGFVEYRSMDNLVITHLLTQHPDPQRGTRLAADPALVGKWRESIRGGESWCLTDELNTNRATGFVQVQTGWDNPYFQRWVSSLEFLKSVRAKWVWLTDGTDVVMNREPWDEMEPGVLYVGDEPCTVTKPWLAAHHKVYQEWIWAHSNSPMLNCGVVGGDYDTVVAFVGDMVRELAKVHGRVDYDMGPFNYVAHSLRWQRRVEHGPHVTSVFKGYQKSEDTNAWWIHK